MGDPYLADGVVCGDVLLAVGKAVVAFVVLLVSVMLMVWFERKVVGRLQNRIGPNIAGPFGLFQTLADGTKRKNYYVPESVGIACGLLVTALHNAGLVSLTHTPSPMGFLNEICERPENEKAMMIVVTGHPAEDATIPKEALNKKPLEEMASFL